MGKVRKTVKKATVRKAGERNGHINAGVIQMNIQGGELDGETIEMDASIVKLCADPLQIKHKLTVKDGYIEPTAEFAADLCEKLKSMGYRCTPTIGLTAWAKAAEYFAEVQKKTKR